jgi:hypothetical protein
MSGLERRLRALEGQQQQTSGEIPPEVEQLLRALEREDLSPAPEIREVSGTEWIAAYRTDPGWQSEESQALLDSWEDPGCE